MIDAEKLREPLRNAFLFLDRMAGEGMGYDGDGVKLDADDVCLALSDVLGANWENGPFAFADSATAAILAMVEERDRLREALEKFRKAYRIAGTINALHVADLEAASALNPSTSSNREAGL